MLMLRFSRDYANPVWFQFWSKLTKFWPKQAILYLKKKKDFILLFLSICVSVSIHKIEDN